jgi:hypothetical protein
MPAGRGVGRRPRATPSGCPERPRIGSGMFSERGLQDGLSEAKPITGGAAAPPAGGIRHGWLGVRQGP